MKLDKLDYPYCDDYVAGYIVINRENRRTLVLKNKQGKLHSTQYARYLIACKLKRYLTKEETVDHIDNDKTNDSLDNLCIMSLRDNVKKSARPRTHGHSSMIKTGCKCEKCVLARREWNKRSYNKHKDEIRAKRRAKRVQQVKLN